MRELFPMRVEIFGHPLVGYCLGSMHGTTSSPLFVKCKFVNISFPTLTLPLCEIPIFQKIAFESISFRGWYFINKVKNMRTWEDASKDM